jgi:hypothetical protein
MPTLRAVKSWYSAERGGFITLQDDVLGIVSQIRRLYGDKITVELDDERGVFHFVGHENGEDYLVFTVSELVLDRAKEQAMRESIGAMGEELLFHIQKEGNAPHLSKPIYLPRGLVEDA